MFEAVVKVVERFKAVAEAARKAALNNLKHTAAGIRKDARASITNDKGPSAPGTPPHSRRGQMRNAIVFSVDEHAMSAVIGPRASIVGTSASAMEFGGEYKGAEYPERPFMGPALEGRLANFAGSFAGSIGE